MNNFPYTWYHIFIIKKKKKRKKWVKEIGEKTGHGFSDHQSNNKTNADRIPRKMYIIFWGSIFTAPSYVAHKHRCALPQPCSMKRDDTEIWNLWGEPSMVRAYRSPLSFDRIKYLYRRTYCGVTKFEILPTSLYLQPAVGPGYLLLGQTLDTRLCSLTFERKTSIEEILRFRGYVDFISEAHLLLIDKYLFVNNCSWTTLQNLSRTITIVRVEYISFQRI